MKVPIKVAEVKKRPDGTAEVVLEFDEDIKRVLMKAWGVSVWDEARAQKEFTQAIHDRLIEESAL